MNIRNTSLEEGHKSLFSNSPTSALNKEESDMILIIGKDAKNGVKQVSNITSDNRNHLVSSDFLNSEGSSQKMNEGIRLSENSQNNTKRIDHIISLE